MRHYGTLLAGCLDNTMSREEPWYFGRLGQLVERADKTSRSLDVKYFHLLPSVQDVGSTLDENQWAALLRSASSFQMYRQKYGRIAPEKVVEFLILDRNFPRAILHCITRAEEYLHAISGTPMGSFSNAAEQHIGQLRAELAYAGTPEILRIGLHEFLDQFQTKLNRVGAGIHAVLVGQHEGHGLALTPSCSRARWARPHGTINNSSRARASAAAGAAVVTSALSRSSALSFLAGS